MAKDMSTDEYALTRTAQPTADDRTLDAETLSEIFARDRVRALAHSLKACDRPMEIDELAREVAANEAGADATEVGADRHERVLVSLYEEALPRMEEAGLATVDREDGVFVAGGDALAGLE
jgi:histone H3/H4